jgi:mannosyltransferase
MSSGVEPVVRGVARPDLRAVSVQVTVVAGVALVLGLIRLGTASFWVDEAFTESEMRRSLVDTISAQYHLLYYWIERPWAAVAGTSEWALRFPSVLGAMLAGSLMLVLGRRLFDPWVGLVSGLLVVTSPFVVQWSQQTRGYTMLLALVIGTTLLLLRALERRSRLAWAVYGLAFTAVVVWQPVSGVLLFPAHALLAAQRRENVLPHGLLAAVVIGALAVPWAAVTAMRSTGEGVVMNWLKFPTEWAIVRGVLDVSGASGVGLVLAVVGLVVLRRRGDRDLGLWLGVWALSPFVLALLVSIGRPIYLDRYLIVAAPAFALLAGAAIVGVGRRVRIVLVGAVVVATVAGLGHWYSLADEGNWHGEDWRSAVATVVARQSEADAIVVAPWSSAPAATYYGADVVDVSTADSIWVLAWSETGDDITAAERRALGFGAHVRAEKLDFGRRLSAQLWTRPTE